MFEMNLIWSIGKQVPTFANVLADFYASKKTVMIVPVIGFTSKSFLD